MCSNLSDDHEVRLSDDHEVSLCVSMVNRTSRSPVTSRDYLSHLYYTGGGEEKRKKNVFLINELNAFEKRVIQMLSQGKIEELNFEEYHPTTRVSLGQTFQSQEFIDSVSTTLLTDMLKTPTGHLRFNISNIDNIRYTFKTVDRPMDLTEWLSNYDIDWYTYGFCNNLYYSDFNYRNHLYCRRPSDFTIKRKHDIEDRILNKFISRYVGMYKYAYAYSLLYTKNKTTFESRSEHSIKLLVTDLVMHIWPATFGGCVCRDFHQPDKHHDLYNNLLTYDELQEIYSRYPSLQVIHVVNTTDAYAQIPQKHWFGMILTKNKNYVMCSYSDEKYDYNHFFKNSVQGIYRLQFDNCNCGVYSILFVVLLLCGTGMEDKESLHKVSTLYDNIGKNGEVFFTACKHKDINAFRYALFNIR